MSGELHHRFVTLFGPDRRPFGFIDGRLLLPTLASNAKGFSFRQFADAVNHGTDADRARLSQLPGFLPASAAVAPDSDKRDVLSGPVATCVGICERAFGQRQAIRSCGEVNDLR
ncbi:MAG TPA: hypothetical protein VMI72_11675 [Roseiarcus sp.]|nr:hypothetical protein [Roseiarcus sp.]